MTHQEAKKSKDDDQRIAERALLAGETWKGRAIRRENLKGKYSAHCLNLESNYFQRLFKTQN